MLSVVIVNETDLTHTIVKFVDEWRSYEGLPAGEEIIIKMQKCNNT